MAVNTQHRRRAKSRAPLTEERALHRRGYNFVGGVDEVGRGPLAGPVVAGVVVLSSGSQGRWMTSIRDSKTMTPIQREAACYRIRENAMALATGVVTPEEIDGMGIGPATFLAMQRALSSLPIQPQFLLVDAFEIPGIVIPQKAIIKGDSKSLSIAAASVVAKVERDQMMCDFDQQYPGYGFGGHKGYGSAEHLSTLKRLGPSPIHRYSFAPVRDRGYPRNSQIAPLSNGKIAES